MGTLHSRVLEIAADMGTVNFVWAEGYMIGQCCMYKERRPVASHIHKIFFDMSGTIFH